MNQIGLGPFQHAKQEESVNVTQTQAVNRVSRKQHTHDPNASTPPEGQLAVDILQGDHEMIVLCPIAGVEKSDIRVSIQDDVLTIRGERKKIARTESKTPIVGELFWGVFSRSIVLPDYIDRKNISARCHEHILIISIPKTEDFKTRVIHLSEES
jgi:HSP20 family protein